MTNSLIMIGTATIKTKKRYRTRKAPPPPVPVMYGNFHMFPRPTAEPRDTISAARVELNPSLFFVSNNNKISPLIRFNRE